MRDLRWVDDDVHQEGPCPSCRNEADNRIFLRVGKRAQVFGGQQPVDVARCGRCGSAWFPRFETGDSYPAAVPSGLTDDFWLLIDHYVELVGGLEWKVPLVEQMPRAKVSRVLDVGCNTGLLLDYLARIWDTAVLGLEPSLYGLAGAERFSLPIQPTDMADLLASGAESFDLVITTEVIEHVSDPTQFLQELRSLVRPGGFALVTTPDADGLLPDRAPGALYAALSVGSHRIILSAGRLRELAHAVGFSSVQISTGGAAMVAVLSDEPFELTEVADSRSHLLRYHQHRLADRSLDGAPIRWRLADLIAAYVLTRELGPGDSIDVEREIDDTLEREFDIDVRDLSSLMDAVGNATTIFDLVRAAPSSLPSYLFYRGHRDDLSEVERTEMWEVAVALIALGLTIDPVNMWPIERTLGPTLLALNGRVSQRWNAIARAQLATAPELAGRTLPYTAEPAMRRILRSAKRHLRSTASR